MKIKNTQKCLATMHVHKNNTSYEFVDGEEKDVPDDIGLILLDHPALAEIKSDKKVKKNGG